MVRGTAAVRRLALCASLPILVSACSFFWDADLYTLPALTKEMMYADYDYMKAVISDVSPFITLQKKAYGMDMLAVLDDHRAGIESVSDSGDFYRMLTMAVGALKSQHLYAASTYSVPDTNILDSSLYEELIFKQRHEDTAGSSLSWSLPLVYWNGRYILYEEVTANGVTVPQLSALDTVDGASVYALTERYCPERTQSWDFTNGRFYGDNYFYGPVGEWLPLYLEQAVPGGHLYGFTTPSAGTVTLDLKANDTVTMATTVSTGDSDAVQYFSGCRTLYIRLPRMSTTLVDGYAARIKSEYAKGTVDRIIIDICGNPGGSDLAWASLLEMIIPADLTVHATYGVRDSATLRETRPDLVTGTPAAVPLLDGQQFPASASDLTYNKRADSICFNGPIYLVTWNIYSSAGSFLACSHASDQITSIGVDSDLPLGRGTDPIAFKLPNSHIRFRIEPVIDLTRPDTLDGLLGRSVEIPITVSDQELVDYLCYTGDRNSENFVCTLNPFTKAALRQ